MPYVFKIRIPYWKERYVILQARIYKYLYFIVYLNSANHHTCGMEAIIIVKYTIPTSIAEWLVDATGQYDSRVAIS